MVRLKRILYYNIKASSITETIVATSIIVIVFSIAIFSIHTILKNSIESSTSEIETEIHKITYQNRYNKLKVPTSLEVDNWIIHASESKKENINLLFFEATSKLSKKKLTKTIISNED
ncbi:MAG: hypothetical protein HWD85_00025 [Flavobacteriaceae bacterium]|nr:hypothetical protein [Flavobacteriaceae bacterium]